MRTHHATCYVPGVVRFMGDDLENPAKKHLDIKKVNSKTPYSNKFRLVSHDVIITLNTQRNLNPIAQIKIVS